MSYGMHGFIVRAGLAVLVMGCAETGVTAPSADETMIAAVSPAPGALSAPVGGSITVTFRHPMGREDLGAMGTGGAAHSMEMVLSVHEGSLGAPALPGLASWSSDRRTLTFTPATPLKPSTTFILFLGGRMTAADGRLLTPEECEASAGMAGTTMMSGAMGSQRGAAVHHEMAGVRPSGMGHAGSAGMMGGVTRADGVQGMTFSFVSGT